MRPILLKGHERALSQVKFNSEGDLIFSCSKDPVVNVWYTHNGERLGTYSGHNGSVWTVDVDSKTQYLVTGSADNTMKLWDVQTGVCLFTWTFETAVKRVAWSSDNKRILCITEQRSGVIGALRVFDINREQPEQQSNQPLFTSLCQGSKFTVAAFVACDEFIVTGHEDGTVNLYDLDGELFYDGETRHKGFVTDLQVSKDGTFFITSSKDHTAKLWSVGPDKTEDGENFLTLLKTYKGEAPINSAGILSDAPYILMGGGQNASEVTTTSARQGHFDVEVFHRVFEDHLAVIKAGFGPCNTIAIHPAGTGFIVGGEDGYVRIYNFDPDFYTAKPYGVDYSIEL